MQLPLVFQNTPSWLWSAPKAGKHPYANSYGNLRNALKNNRKNVSAQGRPDVMNDKIRKYVILSLPYLFIFWAFLKLGTAYRLADGGNFVFRVIDMTRTIAPAFSNIAPGFNGTDWLVGIAGAAAVRYMMYEKSKKARNSERVWNTARHDSVHKKT